MHADIHKSEELKRTALTIFLLPGNYTSLGYDLLKPRRHDVRASVHKGFTRCVIKADYLNGHCNSRYRSRLRPINTYDRLLIGIHGLECIVFPSDNLRCICAISGPDEYSQLCLVVDVINVSLEEVVAQLL